MIQLTKTYLSFIEACIARGTMDEKIAWEQFKNDWFGTNRYKIRDKQWPELNEYFKEIDASLGGKVSIPTENMGTIKACYKISKRIFERIKDG
jgi:hypothetical protein